MSLDQNQVTLDEAYIKPNDLAQVILVAFGPKAVGKTHLLSSLQARADSRGVCAGDLVSIMLVDFVRTREIDLASKSKPKDKESLTFMNNKARGDIMNRFNLRFPQDGEDEQVPGGSKAGGMMSPSKQRSTSQTPLGLMSPNNARTSSPGAGKNTMSPGQEKTMSPSKTQTSIGQGATGKTMTGTKSSTAGKPMMGSRAKTPTAKAASAHKRGLDVIAYNNKDLQRQYNYITQEKSKAEILAVQTIALIKKSNEDYNAMLKYAWGIREAMINVFDELKGARAAKEKAANPEATTYKKKQDEMARPPLTAPLPLTEKQMAAYKIVDKLELRTNNNEISPIMNSVAAHDTPVRTVSYAPPPGGLPSRSKSPTTLQMRTGMKVPGLPFTSEGKENMRKDSDTRDYGTPMAKEPSASDVEKMRGARNNLTSKSRPRA